MKYGHWIDLTGIEFDETQEAVTWLQAMPLGSYDHPLHGTIEITSERVQRFANNIKDGVRGTELDIDYDHKASSGKAAGWVKDAEARQDGLWVAVAWTEDALSSLKKQEYRYFSPEFVDGWKHPKTGKKYQDVMFGGAITNRPFLKDILPINLSEVDGGVQVDEFLMQLREKLNLSEDATEEQILAAASVSSVAAPEAPSETGIEPVTDSEPQIDQLTLLAETNPAIKQLMETVESQNSTITELVATNRLNEANAQIKTWQTNDRKIVLAPAVEGDVRKLLTEAPKAFSDQIIKVIDSILEKGVVELGERGGSKPDFSTTATEEFTAKVQKKLNESNGQLSYGDAVIAISLEEPQLVEAYRRETQGS